MAKYKVIRQHYGDRMYVPGEERELAEGDARHLIPRCLEPIRTKSEQASKNKAEGPAPKNKASGTSEALRSDGPTVEEYVAGGYSATGYPPRGYASRSTAEEIATAVAAQAGSKSRDRYEDLTVAELKELAAKREIDLGEAKLKADIIAALELADEQGADEPEAGE